MFFAVPISPIEEAIIKHNIANIKNGVANRSLNFIQLFLLPYKLILIWVFS